MPFPEGVALTTLVEDYFNQSGTDVPFDASGTVTFTAGPKNAPIYLTVAGFGEFLPGPIIGVVDDDAHLSVDLLPNDLDSVLPEGFTYHAVEDVTVTIGSKTFVFDREYDVPVASSDGPVRLSSIAPTVPSGGGITVVLSVNGHHPDAAGNVVIDTGGTVTQVAGQDPDEDGHVALTAADVDADPAGAAADVAADLSTEVARAEAAEAAKYAKPGGGIPSTDMTAAVQASLGKADTAEQASANKNVANGYPGLDAGGRVLAAHSALAPQIQDPGFSSTITLDASTGSLFRIVATADFTLEKPTNLVDGQTIEIQIKQDATGGRAMTLDAAYNLGTQTVTLSTAPGARDKLLVQYSLTEDVLDVLSFGAGY